MTLARALLVFCALLSASCDEGRTAPPPSASPSEPTEVRPETPPIVVGWSALRISLPIFVADRDGLFEEHGVRVELRRYETAQPLVEELVDGRIDAGGYAALPIVLTVAARAEQRVRVATALVEDEAHPISYLLRRTELPLGSIAELRGRRVGVLPTLAYTSWLRQILEHAGLEPSEVTIVPIAPPLEVQALAEGGVDALFTGDPMATAAIASGAGERLGPEAVVPDALGGAHVFGTFLLADALSRERPTDAVAIVAALDEAIAVIAADPLAARAAMLPFVGEADRERVTLYPPSLYLPSAQLDEARLASEVARVGTLGLAPAIPDVAGWAVTVEGR